MTKKVELTDKVKEIILDDNKMDLVGFTPVSRFEEAPLGRRPQDILPTAKSVIVFATHVLDTLIEGLPYTRYEYTGQFYLLNGMMQTTAYKVSRYLEDQNLRANPLPAAYPRVNKPLFGIFSHRHAAVRAGLGEFALNNLLTTPQYGANIRLISVITEAEFEYDDPYTDNYCQDCRDKCQYACVDNCPVTAISKDGIIDKHRCLHYQEQIMPWSNIELRCGMCITSCPLGKKEWPTPQGKLDKEVMEMKKDWTGARW